MRPEETSRRPSVFGKAFADSIGADAYCVDAVEAVDAAKRLTA